MTSMAERIIRLTDEQRAAFSNRITQTAQTLTGEPIAVIGIGCRFPGGANGPRAYWELLQQGRDVVTEIPADRWDAEAYFAADPDAPGKTNSRWGAFLDDVAAFDADRFALTPREAAAMDPQQRLLLEVTVEALAHAGVDVATVRGSRTGFFAGVYYHEYQHLREENLEAIDAYSVTGNAHSVTVGRISYALDLRGPSVAVDTACSSSLVAVHLACQSLRLRESDLTLAGGVNVILSPVTQVALARWRMLAPDGRCKAFDAAANGFVRGEGCGVVVLKRLADAVGDGDRVLAVLRGCAVNSDGRSQGITAPNGGAQRAVISDALTQAGIDAARVGLIETHGTGTSLGDPIEFDALAQIYGAGEGRCALGAVKTNLGHLEAAAGIAGFIKAVLALRHATVPANLHFHRWNPNIDPEPTRFFVPTEPTPWPVPDGPRLAAVSSFGFGGTNAHAVLEEAPLTAHAEPALPVWRHTRHWLPDAGWRESTVPDEWTYTLTWHPSPLSGNSTTMTSPQTSGHWLVVTESETVGSGLCQALGAAGTRAELGGVDELDGADHVVYVADSRGGGDIAERTYLHTHRLLAVLRAIEECQDPPRLHVVTCGGLAVGEESVDPAQAALSGLARGIALEQGEGWGALLDVDDRTDMAAALLEHTHEHNDEDQVAYRAGVRHVPRLRPVRLPPPATAPLSGAGTHLVAGATGAIGACLLEALLDLGARHLTLVSRNGFTGQRADRLAALRRRGATVVEVVADAADEAAMTRLFARFGADLPALAGVYNAAFAGGPVRLPELAEADISAMFRPKVDASALLDRLSCQHSPRHFVLFSSITGVLGSRRLAHYAAASAFLDGLAHSRAAAGLPATAIDWGIWSGRLTVADSQTRAYISSAGLRPMADKTAIRALGQMLAPQAPTRAAVVAADWSLLAAAYRSRAALRLLDDIQADIQATRTADRSGGRSAVEGVVRGEARAKINAVLPADRRTVVHDAVRGQVAAVMRLPSAELLDPAAGFFQLGMDSLMSVQLQRRLATVLDLDIPPATVFNHPSVRSLTDHLLTLLPGAAGSPAQPQALPAPAAVSDPIAVVGIGCRFPGAVSGAAEFWRLLDEGRDGIVETPADRWDADAYDAGDPSLPGTIASRLGGFLTHWAPDEFDAEFFGISPREAETMDPQQRLLLETAVEALAHAGLASDGLRSSRTGVFVGITTHDYFLAWTRQNPIQGIDAYTTTGNAANFAAGRLSYLLGLTGPSLAVDTACSSSLVALHLAAQALRTGDADTALAAGVNLMLTPEASLSFSRWGMLSPQGRCKTFDADADGFVRGEGCGVVLLKRLADAVRDGDRVLAVLRGTAVNQDGASSGQTVPSGLAQETVIRTALHRCGLEPDDVDYIEAHGAATALGDPIELEALGAVFGAAREQQLIVGSVKTNLGHLEAAAGIAGFIKTVLALAHGRIPPHLSFRELTPRISDRAARVAIPVEGLAWPCADRPARAGVSSFGASGTNAHAILEASPPHASAGRSSVWIFSGQGSQWPGMGRRLLAEEPAFAAAITELDPICMAEAGFSLHDVITAGAEISGIDRVQPVLFGMQVALAALWRSRGVQPAAVIGHSMGEVAAAVVAEALTPADGMRVIARRSRLLRTIAGHGAMAVLEHLVELPDGVEVASYSAPRQVVISGDACQVANLVDTLTAQDIFARLVKVDVASHSPQVDPLLPELAAALAQIEPTDPRVRFYSTVFDRSTGHDESTGDDRPACDAAYWVANLRRPVRFSQAVSAALADGHRVFTEISPHPLLTNAVLETAAGTPVAVVATLRRDTHTFEPALPFELPAPKWRRKSYWFKTGPASYTGTHPLLGVSVPLPGGRHAFHGDVGTCALPWLADHQVQGAPVLPAAAYVEMALAATAAARGVPIERIQLRELALEALLPLADTTPVTTLLSTVDGVTTIEVLTGSSGTEWLRHASVRADVFATPGQRPDPLPDAQHEDRPVELTELSALLRSGGQQHGPAFTAITAARVTSDGTVVGRLALPGELAIEGRTLRVHPVLLDAAFQLLGATPTATTAADGAAGIIVLPDVIAEVRLFGDPRDTAMAAATLRPTADPARFVGAVALADATGTVLLDVCGISVVRLAERAQPCLPEKFFELIWQQSPLGSKAAAVSGRMADQTPGRWLILADTPVAKTEPVLDALRTHPGCVVVNDAEQDGAAALTTSPQVIVLFPRSRSHHEGTSDPGGVAAAQQLVMLVMRTVRTVLAAGLRDIPRLYLVTQGAQPVRDGELVTLDQASLRGVARVLAYEHPELRTTLIDLDPSGDEAALLAELHANAEDDEVAFRDGVRWCARLAAAPPPKRAEWVDTELDSAEAALELVSTQPGLLDGLRLRAGDPPAPQAGQVTIRIEVAALNFSDVLKASGAYPMAPGTRAQLGGECAGTVAALGPRVRGLAVGDRVVAYAHGALGTYTTAPAELVAHLPEGMSAQEGVTLPVAYGTAWYAFTHVARLRAGERVLIHAATGGVGLAAVAIAQALGAEIYATAGSAEKRAYLRERGITEVYDSRALDWCQAIRDATGGLGVDVVLNSLPGEALRRGVELLAPDGRFVELGKKDTQANTPLPLRLLAHGASFTTLDLDLTLRLRPEFGRQLLTEILAELHAGRIAPLPHRSFPLTQASEAFQLMARAGHIGKIVLTCRDLGRVRAVAEPGPAVRRDGGYLVTGGLSGLGLVTAEWLARQRAGLIVLNGRTGPDGETSLRIEKMRAGGTRVEVVTGDLSVPGTGVRLAGTVEAAGYPLRGIVHSAAVLADATALRLTPPELARVFAPKVRGAWHLHEASAGHPLDFFVVYSSAASLIGSPGQTAYAAANSWLDGFISYRRALGLPGLAINWGPWSEVGQATGFAARGYQMISPDEGVQALAELIESGRARAGVFAFDTRRWFQTFPAVAASPFFAGIEAMSAVPAASARIRGALDEITSGPARLAHLEAYLTHEVRAVLHMDTALVDRQTTFASLGVDSLMALELRNRIEADCGVRLPATVVWSYPCVAQLAGALAERIGVDLGPEVAGTEQLDDSDEDDLDRNDLDGNDHDLLVRICAELPQDSATGSVADG